MKKIVSTLFFALPCIIMAAQSVNGLEIGSYYTKDAISTTLSQARELSSDNGQQLFISGTSSFYFDFTGAYENNEGRFVHAEVRDDSHTVKFPFGEFKVGDSLDRIIALHGDLSICGRNQGECQVSYTKTSGVRISALVRYNEGKIITEITDFRREKVKDGVDRKGKAKFFNSVSSAVISGNTLKMGFPLSTLLDFGVDVEFSQYPNGVCLISTGGRHPMRYFIRYDLEQVVREILPIY